MIDIIRVSDNPYPVSFFRANLILWQLAAFLLVIDLFSHTR